MNDDIFSDMLLLGGIVPGMWDENIKSNTLCYHYYWEEGQGGRLRQGTQRRTCFALLSARSQPASQTTSALSTSRRRLERCAFPGNRMSGMGKGRTFWGETFSEGLNLIFFKSTPYFLNNFCFSLHKTKKIIL